ncbi:hypothetical protein [Massilia sp. CF038]|uniref:hypothetical protein n=1 Tax=Massilia sp. CF038 TaxID=1881045 RepID=UPI00090FC60B|nr:hypothetical protein [Massilia sp. CF038]SHG45105.1 hypothetical protein SAMN05428948_0539 [Massilia sp. CF038]
MKGPKAGEEAFLSRPPLAATLFCLLALAMAVTVFAFGNFSSLAVLPNSEIRILNNTNSALYKIVVNGQAYGDLQPGKASGYHNIQPAYRFANISLIAGARKIQLTPDDYVGEAPLGHGKFSYVIKAVGEDHIDVILAID